MTFREKYESVEDWYSKVLIMEIYHLAMTQQTEWAIKNTAQYFGCSFGLVSENLRLAELIHRDENLIRLKTRREALRYLEVRHG